MKYEIRIFKERFNINPDYYQGNEDVWKRIFADNKTALCHKWIENYKEYEGETYSVWDGDQMIVGGPFDQSDIDTILEYLDGPVDEPNLEEWACDFADWLVNQGYWEVEDSIQDSGKLVEDFKAAYDAAPRLINLLRTISN